MVYRVTTIFGQAMDGASETIWLDRTSVSQAAQDVQDLLGFRSRLMNQGQYFAGCRISIEGQKRSSQLVKPPGTEFFMNSNAGITCPGTGTIPLDTPVGLADQFRACLQQKFGFASNRTSNRYLAGIPDLISLTEPVTYTRNNAVAWWNVLDQMRKFLLGGQWKIRAQVLPPLTTIYTIADVVVQDAAPGNLGVTVNVPIPAPTVKVGQKIALQGFRPKKHIRASTLNGTWYVSSVTTPASGQLTLYLRNSAGIDPSAQNFTDKSSVRIVSYDFYAINSIGTQSVCTHKRGRPSLAPVGRRLSRLSLDP